jgi:predicted nucleic acid-binding protein
MIGAIERNIQTVVLDDNAARNKAKQLGLDVTGTLGILQGAYKKGLVDDLEQEIYNTGIVKTKFLDFKVDRSASECQIQQTYLVSCRHRFCHGERSRRLGL